MLDEYEELMQPGEPAVSLLSILARRPAWMRHAACRGQDPELWFPERGQPTEPAKAICAGCTVRDACLAYALEGEGPFGIWGGESAAGRRRFRVSPNGDATAA